MAKCGYHIARPLKNTTRIGKNQNYFKSCFLPAKLHPSIAGFLGD